MKLRSYATCKKGIQKIVEIGLMLSLLVNFGGCGVKGLPAAPESPPWIGQGDYYRDLPKMKNEEEEERKRKAALKASPPPANSGSILPTEKTPSSSEYK